MNWFKDLFIGKDAQAESLPPIPERKPNISEPVISFVETFKANPKRFKVKYINSEFRMAGFYSYHLMDTEAKLSWFFRIKNDSYNDLSLYMGYHHSPRLTSYPSFLTSDEADFIYSSLRGYFYSKSRKLAELRDQRKNRRLNNQREALKKVYCK